MHEAELLINPYQYYTFLKKEGNVYFYIVHPISINPPDNESEFAEFKHVSILKTIRMEGGASENVKIIPNYGTTRRSNNNRKLRNTRKIKKQKKLTAREHFYRRMLMPMGISTFTMPLTPEMRVANEEYSKEIDQRIKDGWYRD
jgi:hypothetical protein